MKVGSTVVSCWKLLGSTVDKLFWLLASGLVPPFDVSSGFCWRFNYWLRCHPHCTCCHCFAFAPCSNSFLWVKYHLVCHCCCSLLPSCCEACGWFCICISISPSLVVVDLLEASCLASKAATFYLVAGVYWMVILSVF